MRTPLLRFMEGIYKSYSLQLTFMNHVRFVSNFGLKTTIDLYGVPRDEWIFPPSPSVHRVEGMEFTAMW
jgi:hypothetical protein